MINKAVILAGGLGKRLREQTDKLSLDEKTKQLADKGLKSLIPIGERGNILDYSIERLVNAGYTQICLVVPPEHEEFRRYLSEKGPADITFAIQEKPLGTADAVFSARLFVGNDSFIMLNSDNLYPENALTTLRKPEELIWYCIGYDRESLVQRSNIPPDRIKRFGIIVPNKDMFLERIEEKTERPEDYAFNGRIMVSMNLFRFTPEIFTACEKTELSPRGEFEITSSIRYGIRNLDMRMKIFYVNEGVLDLTCGNDIAPLRETLN